MIRILANLYKSRGEAAPVLTAADFRLDDDAWALVRCCWIRCPTNITARCGPRRSRTSSR